MGTASHCQEPQFRRISPEPSAGSIHLLFPWVICFLLFILFRKLLRLAVGEPFLIWSLFRVSFVFVLSFYPFVSICNVICRCLSSLRNSVLHPPSIPLGMRCLAFSSSSFPFFPFPLFFSPSLFSLLSFSLLRFLTGWNILQAAIPFISGQGNKGHFNIHDVGIITVISFIF